MSTRSLGEPRTAALPRSFLLWLGAATLSTWGDSVMYFALGWAATGIGPQWGGVVLTTVLLPRTVLLLVGGAVGDRWGARRVMVVGDAVMCLVTAALALLTQPPVPRGAAVRHRRTAVAPGGRRPAAGLGITDLAHRATFLLPVASLCIPLLARAHAWSAVTSGVLVGATVAGACPSRSSWRVGEPPGRRCSSRAPGCSSPPPGRWPWPGRPGPAWP